MASNLEGCLAKKLTENPVKPQSLDVLKFSQSDLHTPVPQELSKPAETSEQEDIQKRQGDPSDKTNQRDDLALSDEKRKALQDLRNELNTFQQVLEPSNYDLMDEKCIKETFTKSQGISKRLRTAGINMEKIDAFLYSQNQSVISVMYLFKEYNTYNNTINSINAELEHLSGDEMCNLSNISNIEKEENSIIGAKNLNDYTSEYSTSKDEFNALSASYGEVEGTVTGLVQLSKMLGVATSCKKSCHQLAMYQGDMVYKNFKTFSVEAQKEFKEYIGQFEPKQLYKETTLPQGLESPNGDQLDIKPIQELSKREETSEQELQKLRHELEEVKKQQSDLSNLVEQRDKLILLDKKRPELRKELKDLPQALIPQDEGARGNYEASISPTTVIEFPNEITQNMVEHLRMVQIKSRDILTKLDKQGIDIQELKDFSESLTELAKSSKRWYDCQEELDRFQMEIDNYKKDNIIAFANVQKTENQEISPINNKNELRAVIKNINNNEDEHTTINQKIQIVKAYKDKASLAQKKLDILTSTRKLYQVLCSYLFKQYSPDYENFLRISQGKIEKQLEEKNIIQRVEDLNKNINGTIENLGIKREKKQSQTNRLKKAEEFLEAKIVKTEGAIITKVASNLEGEVQSWEKGSLNVKPLKTAIKQFEIISKALKMQKVETQSLETAFEDTKSWIESSDSLLASHSIASTDLSNYKQEKELQNKITELENEAKKYINQPESKQLHPYSEASNKPTEPAPETQALESSKQQIQVDQIQKAGTSSKQRVEEALSNKESKPQVNLTTVAKELSTGKKNSKARKRVARNKALKQLIDVTGDPSQQETIVAEQAIQEIGSINKVSEEKSSQSTSNTEKQSFVLKQADQPNHKLEANRISEEAPHLKEEIKGHIEQLHAETSHPQSDTSNKEVSPALEILAVKQPDKQIQVEQNKEAETFSKQKDHKTEQVIPEIESINKVSEEKSSQSTSNTEKQSLNLEKTDQTISKLEVNRINEKDAASLKEDFPEILDFLNNKQLNMQSIDINFNKCKNLLEVLKTQGNNNQALEASIASIHTNIENTQEVLKIYYNHEKMMAKHRKSIEKCKTFAPDLFSNIPKLENKDIPPIKTDKEFNRLNGIIKMYDKARVRLNEGCSKTEVRQELALIMQKQLNLGNKVSGIYYAMSVYKLNCTDEQCKKSLTEVENKTKEHTEPRPLKQLYAETSHLQSDTPKTQRLPIETENTKPMEPRFILKKSTKLRQAKKRVHFVDSETSTFQTGSKNEASKEKSSQSINDMKERFNTLNNLNKSMLRLEADAVSGKENLDLKGELKYFQQSLEFQMSEKPLDMEYLYTNRDRSEKLLAMLKANGVNTQKLEHHLQSLLLEVNDTKNQLCYYHNTSLYLLNTHHHRDLFRTLYSKDFLDSSKTANRIRHHINNAHDYLQSSEYQWTYYRKRQDQFRIYNNAIDFLFQCNADQPESIKKHQKIAKEALKTLLNLACEEVHLSHELARYMITSADEQFTNLSAEAQRTLEEHIVQLTLKNTQAETSHPQSDLTRELAAMPLEPKHRDFTKFSKDDLSLLWKFQLKDLYRKIESIQNEAKKNEFRETLNIYTILLDGIKEGNKHILQRVEARDKNSKNFTPAELIKKIKEFLLEKMSEIEKEIQKD